MTIRNRLALQFLLLASVILGISFAAVFYMAARFRQEEFAGRMRDRGTRAAKLLIQVDEVDEDLLRKIEEDNPVRLHEEALWILDEDDRELFHMGGFMQARAVTPTLLDSVRSAGELLHEMGAREQLSFVFGDGGDRFVVVVSGVDVYGRSKLRNEARVVTATFLIGLVITFLAGRFYAQRALAPVQRMVTEIQGIGATDLARRIAAGNGRDELAQLAASFNALLGRLQAAFAAQRNFIANASHELRTPLTAISGQIEVLLLKDRSGPEYAAALRSLLVDMQALNRLADRLLLMAQAESEAARLTFAPVRMDEVVWAARAEVLRGHPERRVDVGIDDLEDPDDLVVKGNEVLLRSMAANLMENACKYGGDGCARVTIRCAGPEVSLVVEDEGPGIGGADRERIFEPFYRSDSTGGTPGHGIGLSLVRLIANLHGGGGTLDPADGRGARFTVRLLKAA